MSVLVPLANVRADGPSCDLSFESVRFDVCEATIELVNDDLRFLADADAFAASAIRVVKFGRPLKADDRQALQALGAEVLDYVPHFAYLVRMDPTLDSVAADVPDVVWIGPFLPAFKIEANLARELRDGGVLSQVPDLDRLSVSLHAGEAVESARDRLSALSGLDFAHAEQTADRHRLVFRFRRPQLDVAVLALSQDDSVQAIALRWPPRLMNSQAGWLHQSGNSPDRPVFDQGIFGCGQVIGVLDSGLHVPHCSFDDPVHGAPSFTSCNLGAACPAIPHDFSHRKIGAYYKWSGLAGGMEDLHGHGTHVTGSAVGNNHAAEVDCAALTTPGGVTDLDGTAPGAKLISQEMGPQLQYLSTLGGTLYHAAHTAYVNTARIHNNSWGSACRDAGNNCIPGCLVGYREASRDADAVTWDFPELAVFAAAGNSGSGCGPGADIGSPGNAKNVFSVGSSWRGINADQMSGFSSRGPANDRRTRPDFTAQGGVNVVTSTRIHSAATNTACSVALSQGTSMASPAAAGLAALVREYLVRGFYPSGIEDPAQTIANPSAALIRALMINGAETMTGAGSGAAVPNQNQGWGRVHLDNVLYFLGDSRHLWLLDHPGIQSSLTHHHFVDVFPGEPLKVTLVWHDFPALVLANPAIVNQLRLEVVTPGGEVWSQKLSPAGGLIDADPYQDITAIDYDDRNTVHQIVLPAPTAGIHEVRVTAIQIATGGDQPYALAVTGNLRQALVVDPQFRDFGLVFLGQVSPPAGVRLNNQGPVDLQIDSIDPALAPFHSDPLTNCPAPPFTLAAGAVCELMYRFEPLVGGIVVQDFQIIDANGAALGDFTLSGAGQDPPLLDIAPTQLDFGSVVIGQTTPGQSVMLTNVGTVSVDVTGISPPAAQFQLTADTTCPPLPFSLPSPGDQCELVYSFSPTATGTLTSVIDVTTTGMSLGQFSLEGTGTLLALDPNPAVLDFGPVPVGQPSAEGIVTVSNPNVIDVNVSVIASPGGEFQPGPSTTCVAPFLMPAQSSCDLAYLFTPSAAGTLSGTVAVDSDAGSLLIDLQGEGLGPQIFSDGFE
ncbi:MAG TPA: S8 family serine peptidase [Xanthomonadaceae bacterium]|nr:S8 family serine peptidase [Xanthomonadaceae bacterium]